MLMVRHGLKRNVYGHRDFSITDCPGNAAYGMVLKDVFEHLSTEYPALRETQPYTTGKAVRRAQKLLGFKDADIDGIYGPMTAAAVRRLKVRNKLSDDTTLGERAWMILLGI
jgi:peptidoglycan hydrolase-like protein with peptidoglycan-binding domain